MANISILVSAIDRQGAPAGQYRVAGYAEVDGSMLDPIPWETIVSFGTTSASILNQAYIDAAIAAAAAVGLVVGPGDARTLHGGAV
jgi:hypothetical protein